MAEIKVKATLTDDISDKLKKIQNNSQKSFKNVEKSAKTAISSATLLKAAFTGLAAVTAFKLTKSFIRVGSEMEDLSVQFEVLLGSADAAKRRMEELSKFAAKTPFQLKGIAEASRILETLTRGALSTGEGLRLVGDAAAVTGADFANLAMHVGRAYDGLQANRPVGESMMRLQELGLVTGDVRAKIEDLQKAGKGKEAWSVLQQQLKRTEGGMAKMAGTLTGLTSTFKDQLDAAMRDMLNQGVFDQMNDAMATLVETMETALNSGVFQKMGRFMADMALGAASIVGITNTEKLIKKRKELALATETHASAVERLNKLKNKELTFFEKLAGEENRKRGIAFQEKQIVLQLEKKKKIQEEIDNLEGKIAKKIFTPKPTSKPKPTTPGGGGGGSGAAAVGSIMLDNMVELVDNRQALMEEMASMSELQANIEITQSNRVLEEVKRNQDERKQLEEASKMAAIDSAASVANAITTITQRRTQKEAQREIEAVKNSKKSEKQKAKEIEKIQKEAFDKNKRQAILSSIINTALSITKTLSTLGIPVGIPASIAAGVAGAAQTAVIASQQFATGGIVEGPPGIDAVPARLTAGEVVLTKQDQKNLFGIIRGNGGNSVATNSTNNITLGNININGSANDSTVAAIVKTQEDQLEELKEMLDELDARRQLPGAA